MAAMEGMVVYAATQTVHDVCVVRMRANGGGASPPVIQ